MSIITRAVTALTIGLLFIPQFSSAVLRDIFIVKGGTTDGGCDDIKYDLDFMFDDAVEKINFAFTAFQEYKTDFQVRKLALAFFGIEMNEQMDATKDEANEKKLSYMLDGIKAIKEFSSGISYAGSRSSFEKAWLFCNSDWVTLVKREDDFLKFNDKQELVSWVWELDKQKKSHFLREKKPEDTQNTALVGQVLSEIDAEAEADWVRGKRAAYFSRDIGLYRLDDINPAKVRGYCESSKAFGETSTLGTKVAMTLCLRTDNLGKRVKELDTTQGRDTYLDRLEMHSFTWIHEFFHASVRNRESRDLSVWRPPAILPLKAADGSDNKEWPGDPNNFELFRVTEGENKGAYPQADSSTDCLLVSLVNGKRDDKGPVEATNNPQNYAWAIIAAYLGRNGKKMDYSTGKARDLDSAPGLPAPPP